MASLGETLGSCEVSGSFCTTLSTLCSLCGITSHDTRCCSSLDMRHSCCTISGSRTIPCLFPSIISASSSSSSELGSSCGTTLQSNIPSRSCTKPHISSNMADESLCASSCSLLVTSWSNITSTGLFTSYVSLCSSSKVPACT